MRVSPIMERLARFAKIAIARPSFCLLMVLSLTKAAVQKACSKPLDFVLTACMQQLTSFAPLSQQLGNGRSTRAACCVRKYRSETSGRRAVAKSGTPIGVVCAWLHYPGTAPNWLTGIINGHCLRARLSLLGRG